MKKRGCTACGDADAYVGLSIIECSTPGCRNYSLDQARRASAMTHGQARPSVVKLFLAGRSAETVIACLSDLRDFARNFGRQGTNVDVEDLLFSNTSDSANATANVRGWIQSMLARSLHHITVSRRLAVIRGLEATARHLGVVPPSWKIALP